MVSVTQRGSLTTTGGRRDLQLWFLVAVAAIAVGMFALQSRASSPAAAANERIAGAASETGTGSEIGAGSEIGEAPEVDAAPEAQPRVPDLPQTARDRQPLGLADGSVPDHTTIFDDGVPGIANLDPALRDAVRRAAVDAARDGVSFVVDSGWRSSAYQEHLRAEAIAKYGSAEEAARWVASPTTSAHVSGEAVDLGPSDATRWLAAHGAAYGLCQIYDNEPWHYERRPNAAERGCPARYADAAHDPRLQP